MGTGVIALVMAAGASRRFGDADKRLTPLRDGRPLLAATVECLQTAFSDVRVVVGTGDTAADLDLPEAVPVIRAANAGTGLGSSMADAVHTLEGEKAAALAICLGDMPWIQTDTLTSVVQQVTESRIVRPVHQGQPGHPVLFGHAFWPELAQLTGDLGGRQILRRHKACYHPVCVDDPGVLTDVDYPPASDRDISV